MEISSSLVRNLINNRYKTDSDLEAFIIDHFKDIYKQLGQSMDRTQKLNQLLMRTDPAKVYEALKHDYPELPVLDRLNASIRAMPRPKQTDRSQRKTSLSRDGFQKDVFLSYRQHDPDRTWVQQILWPALEEKGVRVLIDVRDFQFGEHLIKAMENAVVNCRYTLAVLTPAYLASNYTELEATLARQLGLEQGRIRMKAIMREPCNPSLDLRARLWLDMIGDSRFEQNLNRLVTELRRPLS